MRYPHTMQHYDSDISTCSVVLQGSTLQYKRIAPSDVFTITLCRFLVELNSSTASSSYSCSSVLFKPTSSRVKTVEGVLRKKKAPNTFAATTRAASSGDAAYIAILHHTMGVTYACEFSVSWQITLGLSRESSSRMVAEARVSDLLLPSFASALTDCHSRSAASNLIDSPTHFFVWQVYCEMVLSLVWQWHYLPDI